MSGENGESAVSGGDSRDLRRQGSLAKAASAVQTALKPMTTMTLQRADSLPSNSADLRHAATHPSISDTSTPRPYGMWKSSQLVGFILGVVCLILGCTVPVFTVYEQAGEMLGIAGLSACFWIFEVVPIYATALLPIVLIPLFKITSTEIIANTYWNWIQFLYLGVFLVDVAMEHVQLPRRLVVTGLMRLGVTQPWKVLFFFTFISWGLSMIASTIATAIIITPVAVGLLNGAIDEARAEDEAESDESDSEASDSDGPKTRKARNFAVGCLLGIAYGASAGGIATIIGNPANGVFAGQQLFNQQVGFGEWLCFAFPISVVTFFVVYAVLYIMYAMGQKSWARPELLDEEYEKLLRESGTLSRDEVVVGIVSIVQMALTICFPWTIGKLIVTKWGVKLVDVATPAIASGALLFFIPSKLRPGEAVLTWRVVQEKIEWGVFTLMGGGFALANGFMQSGLNVALGELFSGLLTAPPLLVNLAVMAVVIVLTQVTNDAAAATLIMPLLSSAGESAVINPMMTMLPAAVACSFSFVLPTASVSNAVVFAKSVDLPRPLRTRDFCRAGIFILVIMLFLGNVISFITGKLVFQSDGPFPAYMCPQSNCMMVNIPGEINGYNVTSQACIILDKYDDMMCRLQDKSLVNISDPSAPYMPQYAYGPM